MWWNLQLWKRGETAQRRPARGTISNFHYHTTSKSIYGLVFGIWSASLKLSNLLIRCEIYSLHGYKGKLETGFTSAKSRTGDPAYMHTSYFGVYLRYVISLQSWFSIKEENSVDYANKWHSSLSGKDHRGKNRYFSACTKNSTLIWWQALRPKWASVSRSPWVEVNSWRWGIYSSPSSSLQLDSRNYVLHSAPYHLKPTQLITFAAMVTSKHSSGWLPCRSNTEWFLIQWHARFSIAQRIQVYSRDARMAYSFLEQIWD